MPVLGKTDLKYFIYTRDHRSRSRPGNPRRERSRVSQICQILFSPCSKRGQIKVFHEEKRVRDQGSSLKLIGMGGRKRDKELLKNVTALLATAVTLIFYVITIPSAIATLPVDVENYREERSTFRSRKLFLFYLLTSYYLFLLASFSQLLVHPGSWK